MGFMGMGMQKWIHKQKPRRPFSKDRKTSFAPIDSARQQEFIPHKKKKSKWYHINLTPILVLLLIALVSIPFIKAWNNYAENVLQEEKDKVASVEAIKHHNEVNCYQYLIQSAEVQLDYKNYDYLLNESIFLLEKYPNSIKAEQLHILALYNLCKQSNPKHCNHYARELKKYKQNHPEETTFKLGKKTYRLK
jgi:hypothetical protein